MSVIYDLDQLAERCDYWMRRLRLQDWDIRLGIIRERDFATGLGAAGEFSAWPNKKLVAINLLDPVDYEDDLHIEYDMEVILVHELLHIHFLDVGEQENKSERTDAEEIAVHVLSTTLVTIDRELTVIKEANNV